MRGIRAERIARSASTAFSRGEALYLAGFDLPAAKRELRSDFLACTGAVGTGVLWIALSLVPLSFAIWASVWSFESAKESGSLTYTVAGPGMLLAGGAVVFSALKAFPWRVLPFFLTFPGLIGAERVGLIKVGVRRIDGAEPVGAEEHQPTPSMVGDGWVAFESEEVPAQTVLTAEEAIDFGHGRRPN